MELLNQILQKLKFIIVCLIITTCQSDKVTDPKLNELSEHSSNTLDSLEHIIYSLKLDIIKLKADTTEAHSLLRDYEILKNEYLNFQQKINLLDPKSKSFNNELIVLQKENENLKQKYETLNKENGRFKILANENKIINQKNRTLVDSLRNKDKSISAINRSYKNDIAKLKSELQKDLDSLKNILKITQDSLKKSNIDQTSTNKRISELEHKIIAKEKELDDLPEIEPLLVGVEIIPHNENKIIKVKKGTIYSKKNIGSVRVTVQAKKIKEDAKPIIIYIQYVITFLPNNSQTFTFKNKLTTIQNKAIAYSDSLYLKPNEVKHKDFEIYNYKYPTAEHLIKIYYNNCNLESIQSYKFSTY
jgi:hypothetical protein